MNFGRSAAARFLGGPSVDQILKLHRGAGPGLDFWRFFLSLSVIFLHSFHVAYGTIAGGVPIAWLNPFFGAILPIFFGLSGFLVAGSALRVGKVTTFLGFRALRLVPALAVEVTLSAVILGPILTTFSLATYFSKREFYAYWGNIVGRVRFTLPGLFEANPVPLIVNKNLWTLHAELICYVILAVVILLGLLPYRRWMLAIWAIASIVMIFLQVHSGMFVRHSLYPEVMFIYAFCTGVIAFLWRDFIPVSLPMLTAAILMYLPCYLFMAPSVIAILPLIYIMIWVGMQARLQSSLFKRGDYSYGLYLYGFVIQQTLALCFPTLRVWWFIFPTTVVLTLLFAIASWHLIEKPALKLKRFLSPRAAAPAGTAYPHEQRSSELRKFDASE